MGDQQSRALAASAARAARAAEQAQRQADIKRRKALQATIADAQQQQKDLRRSRDELRRMERTTNMVGATLRRAAQLGAGSVIAGSRTGSRRFAAMKRVRTVPSSATIREATRTVDQQMRRALETEQSARKQLREG